MSVLSILKNSQTIAVVGLSPNPERASYRISKYMQAQGYLFHKPMSPDAFARLLKS